MTGHVMGEGDLPSIGRIGRPPDAIARACGVTVPHIREEVNVLRVIRE